LPVRVKRIRSPPNLDREILSFGVLEPGAVGGPKLGSVIATSPKRSGYHRHAHRLLRRSTGLNRRHLDSGGVRGAAQAEPRLTYGVRSQPHPCQLEHGIVGIRVPPSMYRASKSVNDLPPLARLIAPHQSVLVKPRPFL
jgi:hypothetical protein